MNFFRSATRVGRLGNGLPRFWARAARILGKGCPDSWSGVGIPARDSDASCPAAPLHMFGLSRHYKAEDRAKIAKEDKKAVEAAKVSFGKER